MEHMTYQELHVLDVALRYLQRNLWDIPAREREELGITNREVMAKELLQVRVLILDEALRIVMDEKKA